MSTLHTQLTNLLPRSQVRALRREYFMRLIIVGLVLGVIVVVIHGILLFPVYLYTHAEVVRESNELNAMTESASTAEERQIKARIASVKNDVAYLNRLSTQPTASWALQSVTAVPKPGIATSGFTYTSPAVVNGTAQMTITGVAATRDSLRAYVDQLSRLPYIAKADLPISAYAKETAIPFTITLTGSFKP